MSLLRHPRLPEGEATHVLASGEFPWLAEALERRGLIVAATQRDSRPSAGARAVPSGFANLPTSR